MRKIVLLLPLLMLFAAFGSLRAAEYRGEACRFILPDGFELRDLGDGSLFAAVGGSDTLVFYHLRTEEKIDKDRCLRIPDAQWFAALQHYQTVDTGKPWFARYDKYTVYRKPDGSFVKVYRYVTTRQIGFLVAKSLSGDWTEADSAASGCRGFRSLWEQVMRAWYWFFGAIVLIGLVIYLRERFASRTFWKRAVLWTVVSGAIYGAGVLWFGSYLFYVFGVIGIGYVVVLLMDGDDDSPGGDDGGDSSSGYDGTGKTFDVNI